MSAASIIHTYIYTSHTINPSVFAICVYTHVYLCVHTLCIHTSVCARVRLTHSNPQTACMLQCAHLTYGCVYLSVYLLPCIYVSYVSVSLCIYTRVICLSICVLCVYLCACYMCIYMRVMCVSMCVWYVYLCVYLYACYPTQRETTHKNTYKKMHE